MKHPIRSNIYYESRYPHVYKNLRARMSRKRITDMIVTLLSNKALIGGNRLNSKLILNYLFI